MSRHYQLRVTCDHCGASYDYDGVPDPHFYYQLNQIPRWQPLEQRQRTNDYLIGFYGWEIGGWEVNGNDDKCPRCVDADAAIQAEQDRRDHERHYWETR